MLLIEQGFDIWPGDVQWLMAQSIAIANRGTAFTEADTIIQDTMARKLLDTNAGTIIRG